MCIRLLWIAILFGLSGFSPDGARAEEQLYSTASNQPILRELDPNTGSTIDLLTISSSFGTILGTNGLATHPVTNELYVILRFGGNVRLLAILDPETGTTTDVGVLSDRYAGLAFTEDGTLYGVTGDGASQPETLFVISTVDASSTLFLPLGNGDDGETIAFNSEDGLLYHASGTSVDVFETIDLVTQVITPVNLIGDEYTEARALTYWRDEGVFLLSDGNEFFYVSPAGDTESVGPINHIPKGFAFVEDLGPVFVRADCDGNGTFNGLSDSLFLLAFAFQGGPPPPCAEATDADGDTVANGLVDTLYILAHAFLGGPPPPPPHPDCGPDPDPATSLGCDTSSCP